MSSPDDSSKDDGQEPDIGTVVDKVDENNEAEIIGKCKELLTKLESEFASLTREIVKHLGKEFASTIKSLLECAICKEIVIGTVSRKCMHSFCHHCLTTWLKRSANCPICRDQGYLAVKNPLIDQFINIFIGLVFTEEEKAERSNLTSQRSIPSSDTTEKLAAVLDPSLDTSLVARTICIMHAHSLLFKIFTSDQFKQLQYIELSIIDDLFMSFVDDVKSLHLLLDSFSQSMMDRYLTFQSP